MLNLNAVNPGDIERVKVIGLSMLDFENRRMTIAVRKIFKNGKIKGETYTISDRDAKTDDQGNVTVPALTDFSDFGTDRTRANLERWLVANKFPAATIDNTLGEAD